MLEARHDDDDDDISSYFDDHGNEAYIDVNYVEPSISFHIFFVQAFKIVVDSCKFSLLLLYIL